MRRAAATSSRRQVLRTPSTKALASSVKSGLILFLAGTLMALAGSPPNLREALQAQRILVAENPNDADLLNDFGNLLTLAGEIGEAEDAYRRALGVDPGDVTSLYNLALVLREQGKTKEAQKTLRSILEIDSLHAWTHYQLATLYAEQRNRTKAVHHYAEAFSIDRSLTSPNVNPHIVENRLVTEALLKMYVDESPSTQAPRIYEEPGNVAELLLPRESAEPAAEPPAETEPESPTEPIPRRRESYVSPEAPDPDAEDAAVQDSGSRQDQRSETSPETGQAAPRMIDSSTIETQRTGQVESDTETSQTGSSQSSSDAVSPSSSTGRPAPSGVPSTSSGDSTGSSSRYIPGVQSTGRLDIELLPALDRAAATSPT